MELRELRRRYLEGGRGEKRWRKSAFPQMEKMRTALDPSGSISGAFNLTRRPGFILTLVAKLISSPSVHRIKTSYSFSASSPWLSICASPSWSRSVAGPYVSGYRRKASCVTGIEDPMPHVVTHTPFMREVDGTFRCGRFETLC